MRAVLLELLDLLGKEFEAGEGVEALNAVLSAAARAISVVTMDLSTAGCAGMVFVSFFAVMM